MSAPRTPPPGFDARRARAMADELERALTDLPPASAGIPARKAALMTLRERLACRIEGRHPIVAREDGRGGTFAAHGLRCTSARGFDGALANWIDRARILAKETTR